MNPYFNINTYLSYEQRILTGQNYNEVDALVFAQLSYYPFELLIADYDKKQIVVTEFAKLILGQQNFHKQYSSDKQIFICKLAQSRRYSNCRIHHMRAVESKETQWAAFTVDVGYDGVAVVAMRGTDGTLTGWEENFQLAYHIMGTGAQLESFRYMKNAASKKIYMTGHSKGGSNICSAYVMSNPYIRDKILRMDNFDGPGVNPEFAGNYSDGYRELKDKLNNFYPADSIIGQLLEDNPGGVFM